jgi:hypothetical protein
MVSKLTPLLDLREAAALCRCSPGWLKAQIERGACGYVKIAGRLYLSPEMVIDFLRLHEHRPRIGSFGESAVARDGEIVLGEEGFEWRPRHDKASAGSTAE